MGLSNVENILESIVDSEEYKQRPQSRVEELLIEVKEAIEEGGGSGDGDMKKSVYDSDLAVANAGGIGAFVGDAISGKVDKVEGKGLSTNDYDNTEKGKVSANTSAIEAMVNVTGACNLLPNNAVSGSVGSMSYTVNANKSMTLNGTTSNWESIWLSDIELEAGTYKLSGGEAAHTTDICLAIYETSTGTEIGTTRNGVLEFTLNTKTNIQTKVVLSPNASASNDTIYPMLYDARLNPTGYVPYAMTNRELTERVHDKVVGFTEYTDDNPYNVWTKHTVNISGLFTTIKSVTISASNPALIADGTLHEATLITFNNNSVTYAVKGGWSGGLNGVNVSFVICGE